MGTGNTARIKKYKNIVKQGLERITTSHCEQRYLLREENQVKAENKSSEAKGP
jgi:hypothetical protein